MTAKIDLKKRIRARQAKTGERYSTARMHVLRPSGVPSESATSEAAARLAVVLKTNDRSVRIRFRGEQEAVTLRCGADVAHRLAPAQHVQVTLLKRWTWNGDLYATGTVDRAWTDVPALGLEPLALNPRGDCRLNDRHEPFRPPDPYAPLWEAAAAHPRPTFEFDGRAWGVGVGVPADTPEACLVVDATEVWQRDPDRARELLMQALVADLRCIDAHVHLGNLGFDGRPDLAIEHYIIAVGIGDLSLPAGFDGLLPWGHLYNRPFLRALHGLGLCLWRLGNDEEARRVFDRGMALNPADNQGIRFCWHDLTLGLPWRQDGRDAL